MPTALETRHTIASERLEVVGELATLINTTFDLEEIFQAAITKLQRVMMFRRASVALVSEEGDHYELHTLFDAERDGFIEGRGRFPLAQGLTGEAIRTGEPLLVPDLPGTEGIRLPNESALSAIIVPLHVNGEIVGALNFGSKESERYGQEDLELAALLARQIETSLHCSKLLSTIESQRERLALQNAKVLSERTRLKALIEASDAAILMVADGRVVHANHALADLIGMPWEVVMGSPVAQVNQAFARCLSEPNDLSSQVAALDAEAEPLRDRVEFAFPQKSVCQRTVVPVVDQRSMLGHLILYRDITREAAAEEAKDEFVSIVSHELRTPLTSVKTSLGLIKNGAAGDLPRPMWELVDIALRNLDRLVRLVDDLLQMSRMQSGRFEFELAPVSLEGAVALAVEAVSGFARDRGVEIEWDGDCAATVLAARDPLRATQRSRSRR